MRAFHFKALICGLAMVTALQPLSNAQTSSSFDKNKLNTYLDKLQQEDKFMGSVALDSAGQQVYAKSVGYKNLGDSKEKAGLDTKYRIGSVTKMFTATMVMQLVEEGRIALSNKLSEYYPEIPNADRITIEQMLRHQSGLYNFTNAPDYPKWMTEQRSHKELLEIMRKDKPQFSPGSKTSYSNTNYVLLGFIIEDITGQSYAEQLQKRIVEPLNLKNTYYGDGINPADNEALSYRYKSSEWNKMPQTDMSIPGGAGAIVSTPADLTDFIHALFNGELISQNLLDKMTATEQRFGLGLMKIPFHDSFAYGHNGGIDGFQAHLSYFPKEKVAVGLTGNGYNYAMNDILIGTLSIYFGKGFDIPSFDTQTISLDIKQMEQYVGKYDSKQMPMEIEVFVEDSTLMAQATGQSAFPLTATSKTTMRFDRAGVVMKFDSLASKKFQQFTLEQAGGKYLFKRK